MTKLCIRGKSAQAHFSFNFINIIVRMVILTTVVLSFVLVARHFFITNIDVRQIEGNILVNRMIYSPCLSYENRKIERNFPGIIDIEKFKSSRIDECIYFGSSDYSAALLRLDYMEEAKTINHNKEAYELLRPRVGIEGSGGVDLFNTSTHVLVKSKDKLKPAVLYIEVLIAR